MGNSTITLQRVSDYLRTIPDLKATTSIGGYSQEPMLTIANDAIREILSPPNPFKWNQFLVGSGQAGQGTAIYTNSWQQDYAVPGLVNLSWLEHGVAININSTQLPKPIWPLEVVRDIELTATQYGTPGQVCWNYNSQLVYGTWAANTTYGQLLGVPSCPANQLMQIQDPNGNYWVVTNNLNATVETGNTQPSWPTTISYPTLNNPNIVATTVTDNTVTWTAVNPNGMGIRLNPIPPQTGVVYQIYLIGQKNSPYYTSLSQTIDPVPDDSADLFRRACVAYAYSHSTNDEVRGKFQTQLQLFRDSLAKERQKMDREKDNTGLVPSEGIMTNPWIQYVGPADPYFPGGG